MDKLTPQQLSRPTPQQYAQTQKMPVTVVLDDVRSLNNVGSFFRTCDAFAVQRIMLCGITGTPPAREIHKTALGAEETVPWEHHKDICTLLQALRTDHYRIIAVEQAAGAVSLERFRCGREDKYALVFGNEVFGVSDGALQLCDSAIEIPQSGVKHSLNVSVAAGVILWDFYRQLYAKG